VIPAGEHVGSSEQSHSFERLKTEVVDTGLCSHCGSCAGLSQGSINMQSVGLGPIPITATNGHAKLGDIGYEACPAKGLDYPALCEYVFQEQPKSWLLGCLRKTYIGYSCKPEVRNQAASGGLITQALVYLMDSGQIDGAVVLRHGFPKPWLSSPIIATTTDEILASSQSVYVPTPVNTILDKMDSFQGRLAYVGLPDQVASLRQLQQLGHAGALRVKIVIGPYVGTSIYSGAIESFLRSTGGLTLDDITELRYRAGEWPGHLSIKTRSGKELRANKFHYNYLTPFFITRSSLISVDFTNELTDISVGDAWNPNLETKGVGYSVIIARSERGETLLKDMHNRRLISLEEIDQEEAISMHGHMIDFKKRGSFIRIAWLKALGRKAPDYGYRPIDIPFPRKLVEIFISGIIFVCGKRLSIRLMELVPTSIMGPLFAFVRKVWKSYSKSTKRKGLHKLAFELTGVAKPARK